MPEIDGSGYTAGGKPFDMADATWPNPLRVTVTISAEVLEERAGLWCDRCFLPSMVEGTLVLMVNGRPSYPFTVKMCTDHDDA